MTGAAESLVRHRGVSHHFYDYTGERIFTEWNTYTQADVSHGYFVRCEVVEQGVHRNIECNANDMHMEYRHWSQ
jgi:hypothetical protein